MKHDDYVANYGPSMFPVKDVHRIAILDIRILNCDRNDENILISKKRKENNNNRLSLNAEYDFRLIPIDHGLSFPDCFEIC